MVEMPDELLVARAKAGDRESLGELVQRHHEVVYRVVLAIVREPDSAADAAQETFLKAFKGLEGFRGDSAFRSWLLSIAANEAKGVLRRKDRRRETPLEDAPPIATRGDDPVARLAAAKEAEQARACLARLPEKQRMAVQLRIDEGLSFREVGEVIGSSEGASRVNYHNGIRRLREMLDK